jgi:hypothetical protein
MFGESRSAIERERFRAFISEVIMSDRQPVLRAWALALIGLSATSAQPVQVPMVGMLPVGLRAVEVAVGEPETPFAVHPSGERIAFLNHGLRLKELDSGTERVLHPTSPNALAWAPDGKVLAAASVQNEKTTLRLFFEGEVKAETQIQGRVNGLAWSAGPNLLAFGIRLEAFRFGTRLTEVLFRWDGKAAPTETVLCDTTMIPATAAKWSGTFQRTLAFALSPLQDEILYSCLHNPPAYDPRIKIMLHHLAGGQERLIAEASLDSGGAVFNGHGNRVLVGDGLAKSRLLDPWEGKELYTLPVAGRRAALSASGRYSLLDGKLYREGVLLASFPGDCVGSFSPLGGSLFLAQAGRLYRLSGLVEDTCLPLERESVTRLQKWRKWLSEGLVTSVDYTLEMSRARP